MSHKHPQSSNPSMPLFQPGIIAPVPTLKANGGSPMFEVNVLLSFDSLPENMTDTSSCFSTKSWHSSSETERMIPMFKLVSLFDWSRLLTNITQSTRIRAPKTEWHIHETTNSMPGVRVAFRPTTFRRPIKIRIKLNIDKSYSARWFWT